MDITSALLSCLLCALVAPTVAHRALILIGSLIPTRVPPPRDDLVLGALVLVEEEGAPLEACLEALAHEDPDMPVMVVVDAEDGAATLAARDAGARVFRRRGGEDGLGDALAALLDEGLDAVLVLGPWARVAPGCLSTLAGYLATGADAVQCRLEPLAAGRRGAQAGWRLRHELTPQGRSRLGFVAGLERHGALISTNTLLEDPEVATTLGTVEGRLRLARAGRRVVMAPGAVAEVPIDQPWDEEGHAGLATWALGEALRRGRPGLLEPVLDLCRLPDGLTAAALAATLVSPLPAILGLGGLVVIGLVRLGGLVLTLPALAPRASAHPVG